MFTGIVTDVGTVLVSEQRGDRRLHIGTGFPLEEIALGASIACSGVCLTVVDKGAEWFAVDLSAETIERTASSIWSEGSRLNLERSLRLGDEMGGHIVTGHVDAVGTIVDVMPDGDSTRVDVAMPKELSPMIAIKGSITLDGASLTVNDVRDDVDWVVVGVNIIPHTAAHTTFNDLQPGRQLNVEVDILARYLQRMVAANSHSMGITGT